MNRTIPVSKRNPGGPYIKGTKFTECDSRISVDTLRLRLTDYEISDAATLKITPAAIDFRTGEITEPCLFETTTGEKILAVEATYSRPDKLMGLQIKPAPKGGSWAFVSIQVPSLCHGHNLIGVDTHDLRDVLLNAQRELCANGIRCNILNAALSRVDLARNVVLSEKFSAYMSVLQNIYPRSDLEMKRFSNGVRWANKSTEQLECYDKKQQMLKKGHQFSPLVPTIARMEWRLFKKRKILRSLGTSKVAELVVDYDSVRECYRSQLGKLLVSGEMPSLSTHSVQSIRDLDAFLGSYSAYDHKAGWNNRAFKYLALKSLLEKGLAPNEICDCVASYSRSSSRKRKECLNDIKLITGSQLCEETGRSMGSLYNELAEKLLAA